MDFEANGFEASDFSFISLTEGTTNIIYVGSFSNILLVRVVNGGVMSVNINLTFSTNTRYKLAFAYKNNDCVLFINGVNRASDTSASIPATSKLTFNDFGLGTSYDVNNTLLYKTRLTNAELAELTTI